MWPSLLVAAISTARIRPLRPPGIVAVIVLLGRERTARPEMKDTNLWGLLVVEEEGEEKRRRLRLGVLLVLGKRSNFEKRDEGCW